MIAVQSCSATRAEHEGEVHLYPCGLRCDRHAPGPAITPVVRPFSPGQRATQPEKGTSP